MDQVLKMKCFSSVNERRQGNTCLILFHIKRRKSAHSSMRGEEQGSKSPFSLLSEPISPFSLLFEPISPSSLNVYLTFSPSSLLFPLFLPPPNFFGPFLPLPCSVPLPSSMQSHLNIVYSAKTLIIAHSGVNTAPLGTAENIIGLAMI